MTTAGIDVGPSRLRTADEPAVQRPIRGYLRRNPQLPIGIGLLAVLALVAALGPLMVDLHEADPTSVPANLAPTGRYPLGTDGQGRNLLAAVVAGIGPTAWVGLLAGAIGISVGTVLAFLAGFFGGVVDGIIRLVVDALLTVPTLLILVSIAASIRGFITVNIIAIVVGVLAWMHPARTIRSQVLTLRQRLFVDVARFSGVGTMRIIFTELLPNMLAYLLASFVSSVSAAMLADIGLEALGLGPQNTPTIGMTIYWSIFYGSLQSGQWWWWGAPTLVLMVMFFGLYFASVGLDELANPRRRATA